MRHHPRDAPLLSTPVSAGFPSPADDYVEDRVDLHAITGCARPSAFLVRVSGDSMRGEGILDGDLAVVDKALAPESGDVVVVDVDGSRSLKVWSGSRSAPGLSFANPRLRPYVVPEGAVVEVWGVVRAVVTLRRGPA